MDRARFVDHVQVNFCVLLERLSMSDLVTVLTVLLHERQVVVYSSHVEVIAPVVESIRALLFPFQWPHLYIPFLPAAYASVCSADVPYIVGMLRETWDNLNDYPGSVRSSGAAHRERELIHVPPCRLPL